MKESISILLICILFISCGNSIPLIPLSHSNITSVKSNIFLHQAQIEQDSTKINGEINTFRNVVTIIFNFIIVIFAILLIITTPVLLLFNWIIHFFDCIKMKNTKHFLLKKYNALPKRFFKNYRICYATLIGNTFGLITWILVSYLFIAKSYNHFQDGLIAYFNFPFKIFDEIVTREIDISYIIDSNLWLEMLFIVGISIINYLIGYTIGKLIVHKHLKKTVHNLEESQFIYP